MFLGLDQYTVLAVLGLRGTAPTSCANTKTGAEYWKYVHSTACHTQQGHLLCTAKKALFGIKIRPFVLHLHVSKREREKEREPAETDWRYELARRTGE